jgi:hypothetical protein
MRAKVSKARFWGGLVALAGLLIVAVLLVQMKSAAPEVMATDRDGDGKPDEWTYLDKDGRIQAFEKDKDHDGRPDWRDIYAIDPKTNRQVISRNEADLDYDGLFETKAFYDDQGRLERVERDRNGDGKVDAISLYRNGEQRPYRIERDDDYDGAFEKIVDIEDEAAP